MRKKSGISFGSLQQKILTLVLVAVLLLTGMFGLALAFTSKNITNIVEGSAVQQKKSITNVSEDTMLQMLSVSMTQSAQMQANIADNIFSEASGTVRTMQGYAEYLFTHRDEFEDQPYSYPLKEMDGIPSVQMQHEAAVNPEDDPDLGLIANMSELLIQLFSNSEVLNSSIIATANGTILYCDDRSGEYFDEDGNVEKTFEMRGRPWYVGAVEAGDLYYTGIELDAFTDIAGIVCSAPVYVDGKLVAVVGADVFLTQISKYVKESAKNGGFVCIINENGEIIFSPETEGTFKAVTSDQSVDLRSGENKELADFVNKALQENTDIEAITVDGKEYYFCGVPMETMGWTVISAYDKSLSDQPTQMMLEAYDAINEQSLNDYQAGAKRSQTIIFLCSGVLLLLSIAGAIIVAKRIVNPIEHMTKRIEEISGTDLAFEMEDTYRTKDEIEVLAEAFTTLSERTREYIEQITHITAEKERIGAELELATKIQADMLPNIFPAFPTRPEFDIYASMTPAKEVGGDFYDFFLIDDDHLGMVMADVSGKGVPAALFMVIAKTLLKYRSQMGGTPAGILEVVNNQLCEGNDADLFVTVWLAILEISTGKVIEANAGHEHPALCRNGQKWELVIYDHSPALAVMEDMEFEEREFYLKPGDSLYVYTDGVAEATNAENELYGNDRMVDALNQSPDAKPKEISANVDADVQKFVGEAPQFDDLTMLCLKYYGSQGKSE